MNNLSPHPIPDTVTICVTSCGRADLLARTLEQFQRYHSGGTWLISEDSTDPKMVAWLKEKYPFARVLSGDKRLGLMGSIDRLYSEVTTPYIFHLEDDWDFDGPFDFATAIKILETDLSYSQVCGRAFDEIKKRHQRAAIRQVIAGADCAVMGINIHKQWYGFSSNPGLLRKTLWWRYQPVAQYTHDEWSQIVKSHGQRLVFLLPGVARHSGVGRHVDDPFIPKAAEKSPLKRVLRKLRRELRRVFGLAAS